jgi:vacuolar-type H+-ATPase subunit F/Vma7
MSQQSFVEGYREDDSHSGSGYVTRMIVMGSAALTQGFAMIGFETWADATDAELDEVLTELLQTNQNALVLLEPYLARCSCSSLAKVRNEGGRIVVTEIPPLEMPEDYHPEVEDLVCSVLGPDALGDFR